MKSNTPADSQATQPAGTCWHEAAMWTAGVAGVFCLVVCALLLWSFLAHRMFEPLESPEVAMLKAQLEKQASNDALKEQIRVLDFEARKRYIASRDFAVRGSWLLAGGMAVFLLCLKYWASSRKSLPNPKLKQEENMMQTRMMSRTSVGLLAGVLLCALAGIIVLGGGTSPWEELRAAEPPPEQKPQDQPAAPKKERGNWPSFRGASGVGIVAAKDVPAAWNAKTNAGILWKSSVPMQGESSPIVWGDRVFVTGADSKRRTVYCFDSESGKLLWEGKVDNVPGSPAEPPSISPETGFAAPTPATDGSRVYAIFTNGDIAAFDFTGKRTWAHAFGPLQDPYGHASSLAIHKNLVLVQLDQASPDEGKSALIALNSETGKTEWESKRPVGASWASPIVINAADRDQIITSSNPFVISHDPKDGGELWRVGPLGGDVAPSPIFGDGLVFACNLGGGSFAVRPDGFGNVTDTSVAWKLDDDLPEICSPLMTGGFLFLVGTYGQVACYSTADQKKLWSHDFEVEVNSSPSVAGKNIYLLDKTGVMHIFEAAAEFRKAGKCDIGEQSTCCPAFTEGRIYIRGKQNLYCVGKRE